MKKSEEAQLKNSVIVIFWKTLKFIDKSDVKIIVVWALLMFFISIIPTFSVFFNKILIDDFSALKENGTNGVVIRCILICVLICGSEVVVEFLNNKCSVLYNKVNYRTTHKLEKKFYSVISKLPMEYFDDYKLRKEMVLAQDGLTTNGIGLINNMIAIISGITSIFSVFVVLCLVSWRLPVAIIASTLPTLIAVILTKKLKYQKHEELVEERRKRDYLISLFLSRKTVKELKIFRAFNYLINSWDEKDKTIQQEDINILLYENKLNMYAVTISKVFTALVMVWLISLIKSSEITVGSYVSLISAIAILTGSLGTIFSSIADLYENNKYLTALFKILNRHSYKRKDITNESKEEIKSIENIKFHNVSFSYPSASKDAIKNVDFEINKGDRVAIIGHNGSGKTTLVNLMMGLYQNYRGRILINGRELEQENYSNYQSKLASVFQDFNCYEMTLRENVAIGNVEEMENDEKIRAALKEVNLEKINKCDLGIMLSPFYEKGIDLSGGEWQRVALARAVFRKAELFFFDEPTSALDPEAEIEFYDNILSIVKDKIFVIVSHRLAVTKFCNKIIVMDNGNIVESGTHDELIREGGLYYNMYKKQMDAYDRNSLKI